MRRRLGTPGISAFIIGESKALQLVRAVVRKAAPTESTVLLTGERGTGKGLIARAIHQLRSRKEKEFVTADCNPLVETLLESELFGHVKGAFTGAVPRKQGLLERVNGGTFFFDEVGNLPMNTQAELMRRVEALIAD